MKLVRLLIYEGPEDWILDCIDRRGIKGKHIINEKATITEAHLGMSGELFQSLIDTMEEKKEEKK